MTHETGGYSSLVVGLGEVGMALQEVLECDGHDPFKGIEAKEGHYDVLHIAFPYNQTKYNFKTVVAEYRKKFTPNLVIIHSTVPVGVSRELDAVHSPIRGVHPHLSKRH